MGIKDLNEFLKNYCPKAIKLVRRNAFRNKRVAIDMSILVHKEKSVATKIVLNTTNLANTRGQIDHGAVLTILIERVIGFIGDWLNDGVMPVLVYDGKPTKYKAAVISKRSEEKAAKQSEIKQLQNKFAGYSSVLSIKQVDINTLQKLIANHNGPTRDDFAAIKASLTELGLPQLQAIGEAERLCSMLAIEGKVAAVLSSDTDNVAYRCPKLLSKCENGDYTCIKYSKIIKHLGISDKTFVDMCIMLGCDYNSRIKGVGPSTIYKLLMEHKSIGNLPDKYDASVLNHKRCRELFGYERSVIITADGSINPTYQLNKQSIMTMSINERRFITMYKSITLIEPKPPIIIIEDSDDPRTED